MYYLFAAKYVEYFPILFAVSCRLIVTFAGHIVHHIYIVFNDKTPSLFTIFSTTITCMDKTNFS